jgi:hypothetical protein
MGRTLPTITQLLQSEKETWNHFRRALRKEDQEAFDLLWRAARHHAAPISMASRPVPMEGILLGMLVGLARQVLELQARLNPPTEGAGAPDENQGLDL